MLAPAPIHARCTQRSSPATACLFWAETGTLVRVAIGLVQMHCRGGAACGWGGLLTITVAGPMLMMRGLSSVHPFVAGFQTPCRERRERGSTDGCLIPGLQGCSTGGGGKRAQDAPCFCLHAVLPFWWLLIYLHKCVGADCYPCLVGLPLDDCQLVCGCGRV